MSAAKCAGEEGEAMSNNTYNIQVPPMPKPEDFGITDQTWRDADGGSTTTANAARAKIRAYENAVKSWRSAAEAIAQRGQS